MYGEAHRRDEYELLRAVTHWSDAQVRQEREVRSVQVAVMLEPSIAERLTLYAVRYTACRPDRRCAALSSSKGSIGRSEGEVGKRGNNDPEALGTRQRHVGYSRGYLGAANNQLKAILDSDPRLHEFISLAVTIQRYAGRHRSPLAVAIDTQGSRGTEARLGRRPSSSIMRRSMNTARKSFTPVNVGPLMIASPSASTHGRDACSIGHRVRRSVTKRSNLYRG